MIVRLIKFITLSVTAATIAACFSHWAMLFELLSHFRMQLFFVSLILFASLIVGKQYRFGILALFVTGINAFYIYPWYIQPAETTSADGSVFKVLLSNVHTANRNPDKLIELIATESPDIIIAQEVNNRWAQSLSTLQQRYPYQLSIPREDNFGIAVYSKLKLTKTDVIYLGDAGLPSLQLSVAVDNRVFTLLATHPLPPISPRYFTARNQQLADVVSALQSVKGPVVLLGDLNTTMWSSYYQVIEQELSLRNARAGFGILPTWPAQLPGLMIPIDHCLVSGQFDVIDARAGADIDSDHLPLIVEMRLAN